MTFKPKWSDIFIFIVQKQFMENSYQENLEKYNNSGDDF